MNPQLIFFVELVLALLIIAGILAVGAADAARTLRVLAGAATGLLLGVILLLGIAGYRQATIDNGLDHISDDQRLIIFAALQLLVLGLGLATGAWALAAGQMARARQWGWFAGLLLAALLIPLTGAALYSPRMLLGDSAAASITNDGTLLGLPYFPVVAILLLVAPLATLAYSLSAGRSATVDVAVAASSPTAIPASAAGAAPSTASDEGLRMAATQQLRFLRGIWPILTLAALQLLLGYQWLVSGVDKLLYGSFPETMTSLLSQTLAGDRLPGFFADFMRSVVLPNAAIFGYLVELAETLAGVGLISAAIVELLLPAVQSRGGWLTATFTRLGRLLDVLAPAAAAGTLLLGVSYYFLDGTPTLLPKPSIAYGGAIDSGMLLALGSVVLLLGHYARRKAIERARDLEQQVHVDAAAPDEGGTMVDGAEEHMLEPVTVGTPAQ